MQKYYDDFSRLPIEKMAQKITDMTFSYQENKKSRMVDERWIDCFESIKKNGARYEFRKEEE